MLNLLPVTVWIEAVTGERWSERIRLFETVAELKRCVWRRKRISPCRQALVYCGRALSDSLELDMIGIREDSVLKLIVMTRSGSRGKEDLLALSDEPSDREVCRQSQFSVCSAPEDTSAKESSAGETEKEGDDEVGLRLARVAESSAAIRHPRRIRTNSRGQNNLLRTDDFGEDGPSSLVAGDALWNGDKLESNRTLTVKDIQDKISNCAMPSMSENGISEEGSEVSSGVIVCDLSNEFRKLKVRRHRHPTMVNSSKQRTRSRTRENHDVSSSEDNEGGIDVPSPSVQQLPVRRAFSKPLRGIHVRSSNASSRCSVCAFRISNGFFCRCGKTLCSRHRSAQTHTCAKLRPKLQQVSD